jgi:hypothetical protein
MSLFFNYSALPPNLVAALFQGKHIILDYKYPFLRYFLTKNAIYTEGSLSPNPTPHKPPSTP